MESMTIMSMALDSANLIAVSKASSMICVSTTMTRDWSTPHISAYSGTHGSAATHTAVNSGSSA